MPTLIGCNPELRARVEGVLAEDAKGLNKLWLSTGYRTRAEQERLYAAAVAEHGAKEARNWAALPGTSNHERGLAADIGTQRPDYNSYCEALCQKWGLHSPLSNEPWHFELAPNRGPMPLTPITPAITTNPTESDDDMPKNTDIMMSVSTADGNGSWSVSWDGGIMNKGNAPFYGSYFSLTPETRNVPRSFRTIERRDGGYRIIATTGEWYDFNPDVARKLGVIK